MAVARVTTWLEELDSLGRKEGRKEGDLGLAKFSKFARFSSSSCLAPLLSPLSSSLKPEFTQQVKEAAATTRLSFFPGSLGRAVGKSARKRRERQDLH